MAVKSKTFFVCSQCGFESARWLGKCPDCGEWNTLVEQVRIETPKSSKVSAVRNPIAPTTVSKLTDIDTEVDQARQLTGMKELDRVLGGGIVAGSVVLLSGDPGIGKSTLLLQICKKLCETLSVLYVSGEESVRQIKLRANRLDVHSGNLSLCSITNIEQVLDTIEAVAPDLVVIDSIQTMNLVQLSSSSGSVAQVRECTHLLIQAAKTREMPVFIVGHVNKDGAIAGPKVLEHMVDTVLYFEGERNFSYRILRAAKNRYGSTNEIGVFEMWDNGLNEVENPSLMLLSGRPTQVSGTCVACVMEGTRPILAEIQALVTKTSFTAPRRVSNGIDFNRMALIIAILEKRCGFFMGNLDAYVNVVGGLRLDEPSSDLPVALSLISNLLDKPIDDAVVAIGEVGLTGEIRMVGHLQTRVAEAYRLGFRRLIVPSAAVKTLKVQDMPELTLKGVKNLREALAACGI